MGLPAGRSVPPSHKRICAPVKPDARLTSLTVASMHPSGEKRTFFQDCSGAPPADSETNWRAARLSRRAVISSLRISSCPSGENVILGGVLPRPSMGAQASWRVDVSHRNTRQEAPCDELPASTRPSGENAISVMFQPAVPRSTLGSGGLLGWAGGAAVPDGCAHGAGVGAWAAWNGADCEARTGAGTGPGAGW